MREILFRGKRIDNGEWVYGYYVFRRKRRGIFGQTITELDFDTHYIVSVRGESFEVDPSTVGMCVPGITDKNGKKIFEGDIVETILSADTYIRGVVKYTDARYMIVFKDRYYLDVFAEAKYSILGNIHDNPELLEVTT